MSGREMHFLLTLADCVETKKGFAFKSKWYGDTGKPLVKVSNFTDASIDTNNLVHIPAEIAHGFSQHELKAGDVIIQTVGSWPSNPASVVGKVIRVPLAANGALLNQNAVKLVPNQQIDPSFLFYLLKSQDFKDYIIGTAQGAASQASITLASILAYQFEVPDMFTQQRIASILSAYDDLIQNNTRRIAILEEMARRLYEEWFVHFRFPADGAATISGARLLDLADVAYGKGLPSKNLIDDGEYPVYGATKIIGSYSTFTERDRTIIAGCRGSVGRFTITEPKCFVTNNSFTFKPKERLDFFWLFFALSDRGLADVVSGSAQPQITLASLSNVELPLPTATGREHFANLVQPSMEAIWNHQEQNTNLRAQRDLLLPKLVSGEIDVSEAENAMEAAQ